MIAIGKDDRITAAERYAKAAESSDLTPALDRRCDVDKLIAAGWATQGDPMKRAALDLYRMATTDNTQGLSHVIETMDGWLNRWTQRKGRHPIPKFQRRELVSVTLRWWLKPTCGYCEGRGFDLVPKEDGEPSQVLGHECVACHGTGRKPLAREVPPQHRRAADHLAEELDRLVLVVTGEMARRLSASMDLNI